MHNLYKDLNVIISNKDDFMQLIEATQEYYHDINDILGEYFNSALDKNKKVIIYFDTDIDGRVGWDKYDTCLRNIQNDEYGYDDIKKKTFIDYSVIKDMTEKEFEVWRKLN